MNQHDAENSNRPRGDLNHETCCKGHPADTSPTSGRTVGAYLTVLLFAGLVYYSTMAPGVLWQDSGMAQIRVLEEDYQGQLGLALAHPLFYMVAQAFEKLPFDCSAYKTNLVSATCGALTVANLFLLLMLLTGSRFAAVVGSISLLLAHTFWQHSVMAEIYTLTCLLLSCQLLCWLKFYRTGLGRWVVLGFFLNGLGCANHLLALLTLLPVGLACIYLVWRKQLSWPILIPCIIVWLAGAGPYEYLIYQQLSAGQPLTEVINSALFGSSWRQNVLNWHMNSRLVLNCAGTLALNFPTVTIVLAIWGIKYLAKHEKWFGKLILGIGTMHFLFAMRYTIADQYVFFITTAVFVSLLIGLGAWRVYLRRPRIAWPTLALAMLPVLVYWQLPNLVSAAPAGWKLKSLLPKHTIPYRDELHYFLQPWAQGYDGPERFARHVFNQVQPNSIVLIDSTAMRPLKYLQITEKLRPDVRVDHNLDEIKDLSYDQRLIEFDKILAHRPIYTLTPLPKYCPSWIVENYDFAKDDILYRITGPKITSIDKGRD